MPALLQPFRVNKKSLVTAPPAGKMPATVIFCGPAGKSSVTVSPVARSLALGARSASIEHGLVVEPRRASRRPSAA